MDKGKHRQKELENLKDLIGEVETEGPLNNDYNVVHNRKNKEYATSEQFKNHNNAIMEEILQEYRSKRKLRSISYWIIIGFALSLLIFISLFMLLKSDKAHLSLLITLTVAVFGNLSALSAIIFKYVFSSTTELTNYAEHLLDYDKDKAS